MYKYISFFIFSSIFATSAMAHECIFSQWAKAFSSFSEQANNLELVVPNAEIPKKGVRQPLPPEIKISDKGLISFNKQVLTLDQLQVKMARLVRVNKNQPVRVRGDVKTNHEHIVRVIDRCRKAGVWNISFATGVPKQGK